MLLSKLNKIIKIEKTYNFIKNKKFLSITSNSKFTDVNTILLYDAYSKSKNEYILEAIKNNTPAIITNKYIKFANITQFLVSNIDSQSEKLIKKLYPHLPYKTIAVTGTNGKTSVVWYISTILNILKYKTITVGTLGHYKNGKKINEIGLTTPAYEELYKYGTSNKNEKFIYIFEASSHALSQNRIRNFPIDIAAITNISNDHLDYHKNMLEYKKTKITLFTHYLSKEGTSIINSRIKNISTLKKKLLNQKKRDKSFGKNNIFFEKKDKLLKLNINKKQYNINSLNLISDVELENLECAITCCLALKINQQQIVKTLPFIKNPPGRLQKIKFKNKNSSIIIDYAHTPDALKRVLISLKFNNKKPVLLFGCGGDRDKIKRKEMGIIAQNYSSKTYITDDNPRNESPLGIRKDILKYCPDAIEIANRKKAITRAIKDLKNGEILLIAGKGHENVQIIKNKKYKFDDYKIVKNIIKL